MIMSCIQYGPQIHVLSTTILKKAVTDMCSYFSKFEDEYSLAMRQAAKEAFEKDKINYKTMQKIVPTYFSKRNSSV